MERVLVTTDILFDFFGTLVHYTPGAFHTAPYQRTHAYLLNQSLCLSYDAFVRAFTAVSRDLETHAQRTCHEYHMDEVGRRFFRAMFGADVADSVLRPFIALFIEEWSRGIVYFDGIGAFLEQLAANYRLSIVSNTHYPALIHQNLARMNTVHYFAQIVTSVEVGIRKPHPAIFQHALAELRIAPGDAIYIGDTYVDDYKGATAAQVRCILLDPQQRYRNVPDRIASLFDLAGYLEQRRGHF
jgi:putative hydrolase of the HAD superfamily